MLYKEKRWVLVLMAALIVFISIHPDVLAASVHKEKSAFIKKLPSIYKTIEKDSYLPDKELKYAFLDLNNDGVYELLAYDSKNPYSKGYLYRYKNKKVTRIKADMSYEPNIRKIDIVYYPKSKAFRCERVNTLDTYIRYYKYKNGKYTVVASRHDSSDAVTGNTKVIYKIGKRKVAKAKYNSYVKKLTKKSKVKKGRNLKWFTY